MTPTEFAEWNADLGRKFPAIRAWQLGVGNAEGLLSDWREVLAEVCLDDALAVNKRMLAGDDQAPGNFASDWQLLPSHVRRLAVAARIRRDIPHQRDEPDWREQRYRCADCRDTGQRNVAHPELFKRWHAGKPLNDCPYHTAIVRCECRRGTKWGTGLADFNEACNFPIPWSWYPKWGYWRDCQEQLAEFTAWAERAWQEHLNSKRFKEFDDWNNQP
jgi:hypothetical protein